MMKKKKADRGRGHEGGKPGRKGGAKRKSRDGDEERDEEGEGARSRKGPAEGGTHVAGSSLLGSSTRGRVLSDAELMMLELGLSKKEIALQLRSATPLLPPPPPPCLMCVCVCVCSRATARLCPAPAALCRALEKLQGGVRPA